jgi:L-gulonolactone oxidase
MWWFPHTGMALHWSASRARAGAGAAAAAAAALPAPVAAAAAAWRWLVDSLFGFHLLQAAYAASLAVPALVPCIARLWRWALHAAPAAAPQRATAASHAAFNFDCLFKQHVSEWALPADAAPAALAALDAALAARGLRAHFPVEVRFSAADGGWLSPGFGRATAWVGIIAYRPYGVDPPYAALFAAFADLMRAAGGRPHWAKDSPLAGDADFAPLYARWHDFKALRKRLDPRGVFCNDWLRRTLGLPERPAAPTPAPATEPAAAAAAEGGPAADGTGAAPAPRGRQLRQ